MKNCKYCGCELPQESKFCTMCGKPVEDNDCYERNVLNNDDNDLGATTVLSEEKPFESDNSYYTPADTSPAVSPVDTSPAVSPVDASPTVSPAFVNPYYQNNGNVQYNAYGQNSAPQIVQQPSLKNCYIKFWKNYTNFSGRARRSEYWYVVLANILISLVSLIPYIGAAVSALYTIAIIVPTLALIVRRLHDFGKEWYYIFFMLIPLAGQIIMLVWLCTDSQIGANKFGENPKGMN